ncbi:MAG: hypothetical protein RLZZ600_669 [Actinomycetota bacterium]|jgi:uncharacterized membrane protein
MTSQKLEPQPDSKAKSAQVTGWVLIGVGVLGGVSIFILSSQAAGDGAYGGWGFVGEFIGGFIGFVFAGFFSIIGIVVLASTSKKELAPNVADDDASDQKAIIKKPGRYQG